MDSAADLRALTAIVLAAGLSRRAAPHHKLLLSASDGSGRSVVRATVEAMCGAGFGEVIVITGHAREQIEESLAGLPVRFVFADHYASGMGHSLAAGVRAAMPEARAFAITPGDLPTLTSPLVRTIASEFFVSGARQHVIPLARGARGHPVIIGAWLRAPLESLRGDVGARDLLATPAERARCRLFETHAPAIARDVDVAPSGA